MVVKGIQSQIQMNYDQIYNRQGNKYTQKVVPTESQYVDAKVMLHFRARIVNCMNLL